MKKVKTWDELTEELWEVKKERDVLLAVASNQMDLCCTCKHGPDKGKPCVEDETLECLTGCTGCPCSRCRDGSEWIWNQEEP